MPDLHRPLRHRLAVTATLPRHSLDVMDRAKRIRSNGLSAFDKYKQKIRKKRLWRGWTRSFSGGNWCRHRDGAIGSPAVYSIYWRHLRV